MKPMQIYWIRRYVTGLEKDPMGFFVRHGVGVATEQIEPLPADFTLRDLLSLCVACGWSLTDEGWKKAGDLGLLDTPAEAGAPLPEKQRRVLDILEALPQGKGLTGKQIITELGDNTEQSTLTKHIIPALIKAGYPVVNKRGGAGYYLAH